MAATSAWIAWAGASLLRSRISALPPGLSTRYISFRAWTGAAKFLKAACEKMRSNDSDSNGMAAASPWLKATSAAAFSGVLGGHLDERLADVQPDHLVRAKPCQLDRHVPGSRRTLEHTRPRGELVGQPPRRGPVILELPAGHPPHTSVRSSPPFPGPCNPSSARAYRY